MRAYGSMMKTRFLNDLQYRTAAVSGIVTQLFFGLIQILTLYVFYREHPSGAPLAFQSAVSYIWLRQAFLAFFMTWYDHEILQSIQSGTIAMDLCRPIRLYPSWFVRTFATRFARAALRCGPILLVAFLIPSPFGLMIPVSLWALVLFLVSMLLGSLVFTAMTMLVYVAAFHMVSTAGLVQVSSLLLDFLCGTLLPLPFYPQALYRILVRLPFGAASDVPFRIYSGELTGAAMGVAIASQLFWLILLTIFGYLWCQHSIRRTVIYGG